MSPIRSVPATPGRPPEGWPGVDRPRRRRRFPRVRAAAALLLAALAALAVTGCGGAGTTEEPTGGLGIVLQATAMVPATASSPALAEAIDAAVADQSRDVVVVADGRPHVAATGSLGLRTRNAVAQRGEQERLRDELLAVVGAVRADDPEVDLLAAVDLAARELAGVTGPRTLVVISSGLSTVAPLAFQEGLLGADPVEVVKHLTASGALPDLAGFTVVLSGLGDTAAPQAPLSRPQRQATVALWTAVFEAAGATVRADERPLMGAPAADLPAVTPVEVAAPDNTPCSTVLPASVLAFAPDSDRFLSEDGAREVLAPLAARLAGGSGTVTVTGTTARVGGIEGQRDLAARRAQRVADLLVALNLRPERLEVVGLGSEFPEYVTDHDASGALLPGPAAQNRTVRITADAVDCGAV